MLRQLTAPLPKPSSSLPPPPLPPKQPLSPSAHCRWSQRHRQVFLFTFLCFFPNCSTRIYVISHVLLADGPFCMAKTLTLDLMQKLFNQILSRSYGCKKVKNFGSITSQKSPWIWMEYSMLLRFGLMMSLILISFHPNNMSGKERYSSNFIRKKFFGLAYSWTNFSSKLDVMIDTTELYHSILVRLTLTNSQVTAEKEKSTLIYPHISQHVLMKICMLSWPLA